MDAETETRPEKHTDRYPYGYEVNGEFIGTDDRLMKGRDVRIGAGLNPAADWRLVEVKDRYTTSVGLEDPIEHEAGRTRVFIAAEGDQDFDFTVNDLGWEWPLPSIGEADIRKYGHIHEDLDIVVEGPAERVIARGGTIDVAPKGVERIYGRKRAHAPVPVPIPPVPVPTHDVLHLTFIVGGEPHGIEARPTDTLRDVLARVLAETEHVGRAVDDWQVTDVPGRVFDLASTLAGLGIHDGMELVASLKTGEAG